MTGPSRATLQLRAGSRYSGSPCSPSCPRLSLASSRNSVWSLCYSLRAARSLFTPEHLALVACRAMVVHPRLAVDRAQEVRPVSAASVRPPIPLAKVECPRPGACLAWAVVAERRAPFRGRAVPSVQAESSLEGTLQAELRVPWALRTEAHRERTPAPHFLTTLVSRIASKHLGLSAFLRVLAVPGNARRATCSEAAVQHRRAL